MNGFLKTLGVVALTAAAPAAASAAVIFNTNLATGPLASPGSVSTSFVSPVAGSGSISFQIQGYISLDGDNFYRDDFSLFVNGVLSYSGTFDLGGGGANLVTFVLPGASSVVVTPPGGGGPTFNGGLADIVAPINLIAGSNTLIFAYASPTSGPGGPLAGPQGLGDEGWGINRVTVSSAVPEPTTWAMMLIGFAGLALATGRRKTVAV
jgi:hypothetical protein